MKPSNKRIFITELPENVSKSEVEDAFKTYGVVTSVEIKKRKELMPQHRSLYFAYVNIDIEDNNLQKCFKDFANRKWYGQYVHLQLARESFLERLKKEREEKNNVSESESKTSKHVADPQVIFSNGGYKNGVIEKDFRKRKFSDTEPYQEGVKIDESLDSSNRNKVFENQLEEEINMIIKNNKGKALIGHGLQIESAGKEPVINITSKSKNVMNSSEANLKRLQSLKDMKKIYQAQKSLIKAALSTVDSKPRNKITFGDSEDQKLRNHGALTKKLFDGNISDEDDFKTNFEIKEQFQSAEGRKLLELQSKYKHDKRFTLDKRFLEDEKNEDELTSSIVENAEQSMKMEKQKEYEILEQVIGKNVIPKSGNGSGKESQRKVMLRFDPSQSETLNYEVKDTNVLKKKRRKLENMENTVLNEKKQEETEQPKVSKEVYYKVTDDLKNTFQEKQEFSLLSTFRNNEKVTDENLKDDSVFSLKSGKDPFSVTRNPFKYDSSDDEDETEDIPHTNDENVKETMSKSVENSRNSRTVLWTEPFFFKEDDFRLQEGFDFIEKMKLEENEFSKLRRDLKEIVKAKVRNNERKNKMFKRKLGGNKNRRKKLIRIKKALRR